MDFFLFKKFIGVFVMPLPIIIILLVMGMMALARGKSRRALVINGLALTFVVITAFSPFSSALLYNLERQYRQFDVAQPVDTIVVLGCSHVNDSALPITSQLSRCSIVRASEAVRIFQYNPNARILTSGNTGGQPFTNAHMNKQFMTAIGVPQNKVIAVEKSKDTEEEAQNLAPMLANKRFVLVTAATHMPRAMQLFSEHGLSPLAAPTDHLIRESSEQGIGHYFPTASNIVKFERWWYETMGAAWQSIKNWFA